MLVITPAIANLIRENKVFRITSAIQTVQREGMQLLDDHMFELWKQKIVAKEEILAKANLPEALAAKIARAERGLFEDDTEAGERLRGPDNGE